MHALPFQRSWRDWFLVHVSHNTMNVLAPRVCFPETSLSFGISSWFWQNLEICSFFIFMYSTSLTHVCGPSILLFCETGVLNALLSFFLALSAPGRDRLKVFVSSVVRITFPSGKEWSVKSNLGNASLADIELWWMQLCQWQIIFDLILHRCEWEFAVAVGVFF